MKTILSLILLFVMSALACRQDTTAISDPRFSEVREFIIKEVTEGGAPSIVVAVAEDGEIVWEEAFGWADVENRVQATPNTMYRLGSIAKPITATAVMRLVEAGAVDLDAPVEEYLGGLTLHYYAGTPKEVTVRRVLQNRAGLPPHNQLFFLDEHPERPPFDETLRRYGNVMFQPGWSFVYSNIGYQLLARVVEQASGMDFPRYVRDSVFTPLGMAAAQVYAGDELLSPTALSYYGINGEPVPQNMSSYYGNGDTYCSAHDLIRFAIFHLKNHLPDQIGVLEDGTIDAMQSVETPSNTEYGLGWYLDVDELGLRLVYHGGQTTGVSNLMVLMPSENLAIVILSNTDYEASKLLRILSSIKAVLIPEHAAAAQERTDTASRDSEGETVDQVAGQRFPEELLGTWKGRIAAYDREIEATLVIDDEGARIELSRQEESSVDFSIVTGGFVLGTFPGSIPTPDVARYEQSVRLALVRSGKTLSGLATAVGWREDRQTDSELSSWIELVRQ